MQILTVMKLLRKTLLVFLCILTILLLVGAGYFFVATKDVKLSPDKLRLSENNVLVYAFDGARLSSTSEGSRQSVRYDQLSPATVRAFVDTEDKRFFSHHGFDGKRIVKAAYNNLRAHSFKQGASTISQQLIKNTHLSQEKTLKRKLQEWKLTRTLERNYSKEEILEKYLNVIYFGHNCFGIEAASRFYFDKSASELDLADSAILAGLVKSPNNYSPFKNPENCQKRKASVLNAMLRNGSISTEEKESALKKPLPAPVEGKSHFDYVHAVFDELTALADTHGFTVGGKIEIYTYADSALQAYLEELAASHQSSDKTMAVLDTESGGFKGYVSSIGDKQRLPGSLLKPLLVYAPALEENLISPATPILDEKINYNGYAPRNYDGKFHGYVSARECLSKSLNVPAVKLLESMGVEKACGYLEKLRLHVEKEDYSLALALGGMRHGFTMSSLLSAFSTFPSGGNFSIGRFIEKIRIDGKEVYACTTEKQKVFSEDTSYLLTDMLKTAAQSGTAKKLRTLPFEIAAKTGTVGTEKGNTDAYALSYTTRDVVGVWLGNADNSYIESTGGGLPCNYLFSINERLHGGYQSVGKTIENFPIPDGVVRIALDKENYYDTHTILRADELAPIEYTFSELFKKSAPPSKTSDLFTNPSIIPPKLQYDKGNVQIVFHEKSPTYYEYKIERYDYATHTTLYQGKLLPVFVDERVPKNKRYVYTVTPIYKNRQGTKIELPAVNTGTGEAPPFADKEILQKDWWND